MNAALVALHDLMIQRNGCASAGGDEDVFIAGGLRDELAIYHLRALGGRVRIARRRVQKIQEASAKSLHLGKRMSFTAQVMDLEFCSFSYADLFRRKTPCADRLIGTKLSKKARKVDCAGAGVTHAGARAY